jgi:hypothetical protein
MERSTLRFVDAGTRWVMQPRNVTWPANATLQLYSPDLALWTDRYHLGAQGPLTDPTIPFDHLAAVGGSTVALPEGDRAWFSLMLPVDAGPSLTGVPVSITAAAAAGTALLSLGATPTVPIDFDAGWPLQLTAAWLASDLPPLVGGLADRSLPSRFDLAYSVMPYVEDAGLTGPSGDLVLVSTAELSSGLQLSLRVRSAYPPEWTPVVTSQWCGGIATHEADGGAERITPPLCVFVQSTTGLESPAMAAATDISLDGVRVMASPRLPLAAVTVPPTGTLSWRGAAPSWELRAFSFDGTSWRRGRPLFVPGAAVNGALSTPLPPGFLTPGRPTYLTVTARSQPALEQRPFVSTLPSSSISVPSGVFHVR